MNNVAVLRDDPDRQRFVVKVYTIVACQLLMTVLATAYVYNTESAKEWIRENYWVSDAHGHTVTPYGVLLLSRLPILRLELHDLPSAMHRRLLLADLSVNGLTVRVGTVHLESLSPMAGFRSTCTSALPTCFLVCHSTLRPTACCCT